MKNKFIEVEVLDVTKDSLKVMLPFLNIPVEMNHPFFWQRVEKGYYKVINFSLEDLLQKMEQKSSELLV